MNNYEHISEAIKLLKENEILNAKDKIKLLFDGIPCLVCFLRKISDEQKKEWDEIFGLKQVHHKYNGSIPLNNHKNYHSINSQLKNLRTYYNHVITSILLICEENYEKANELLTRVIERNEPFDCDIALSLRALNKENDRITRLNDIQRATILNPCSRNFKQLASFYDNDQLSIWDYYMESALSKNPRNQCALNLMINRIEKIKFKGSYPLLRKFINRYKKIIEEDGEQFPLILIATCYLRKAEFLSKTLTSYDNHEPIERPQENEELSKLYTRALDVAEKGKQFFPNINLYDSILSKIHLNLKNFDLAQKYASDYLQFSPNDKAIQKVKKSSKQWEFIHLSKDYYQEEKYDKVIELLDEASYNDLWDNYVEQSRYKIEKYKLSEIYTESLIKSNNPDFKLKEEDYFKKIKQLREGYNEKKDNSITEDEENASSIKLYYPQTEFSFGKYKGNTLGEILNKDSQYIYYCINNLFHFAVGLSLLSTNKELENENYFVALERNYIKNIISDLYIPDKPTLDNNYDGQAISRSMEGDWGGLHGEEASIGYWNTH